MNPFTRTNRWLLLFALLPFCALFGLSACSSDDDDGAAQSVSRIQVYEGDTQIQPGAGRYDMGSVAPGESLQSTFTIVNTGDTELTLTAPVALEGDPAFVIAGMPGSTIPPGGSVNVTIQFSSTNTGAKETRVQIHNNVPDRSPYVFTITATCTTDPSAPPSSSTSSGSGSSDPSGPSASTPPPSAVKAPELQIRRVSGPAIAHWGSHHLGSVPGGASLTAEFAIDNVGSDHLHLSGSPFVNLVSPDPGNFHVTVQPGSVIAPGGSTHFTIQFTANSALGEKSTLVSIASNDPRNAPFAFTLYATAIAATPSMGVFGSGGGAQITYNETLYLGPWSMGNSPLGATLSVRNIGAANLVVSNIAVSNRVGSVTAFAGPSSFSVQSGSSQDFTLNISTGSVGKNAFDVTMTSNDPIYPSFTFNVELSGTP